MHCGHVTAMRHLIAVMNVTLLRKAMVVLCTAGPRLLLACMACILHRKTSKSNLRECLRRIQIVTYSCTKVALGYCWCMRLVLAALSGAKMATFLSSCHNNLQDCGAHNTPTHLPQQCTVAAHHRC